MDDFSAETRKIANILNFWDFGYLIGALRKYTHESSHKRIQYVLQDYFKEKESALFLNTKQKDIEIIKEIFPESSSEEISTLLEEIGNENNRIRIVVKKLLKKNHNVLLKRTFSGDVSGYDTATKRTKISNVQPSTSTASNNEVNSMPLIETITTQQDFLPTDNSMPILELDKATPGDSSSQSTITYSFDNENNKILEEVTPGDQEIVGIIEKIINVASTPVGSTEIEPPANSSYVSEFTEEDPMFLKIVRVSSADDLQTKGGMETIPEEAASVAKEPPHIETAPANNLTVNFVEKNFQPTTFNTFNINMPDNVASTSTGAVKKEDNGEYHIYKYLMEMFTKATRKDVKIICQKYNVHKHKKPRDDIFSLIVSDLLELTNSSKGSSSDDSEKAQKKINSTIVIPHSPEQEAKKDMPPIVQGHRTDPPRNFPEHPLNLISRIIPNPILPGAPQNQQTVIQNPLRNLTAPPTLFPNTPQPRLQPPAESDHVDETIDNILLDLMETNNEEEEEEEQPEQDNRLIYPLMEMFPEACPDYIRRICKGKTNNPGVLDDLISQILENDYPKRRKAASPIQSMDPAEQLEMLKQILPDADPSYLQIQCERFIEKPEEMKVFIANAVENRSYPKLKDYLRRQQISAQQKQYTSDFSVEKFLEIIPEPFTYFKDPKRKQSADDIESQHYAISFLRNHFCKISIRLIRDVFKENRSSFLLAFEVLEKVNPTHHMKSKRAFCHMPEVIQNIPLLQEIAFVEHRREIEEYLRLQKVKEQEERAAAARLMQTCSCCFDDEVMPKHIYSCEQGCLFCKECVQRGAEVSYGDGKLDFACLNNCPSHFSLQTLQAVLKPKLFSKIAIKKQLEEVKAAGIEDLEMCPFCDFATIPAKDDKLFRCLNPDCMKESCRLCKEPSHVPLRCEEVEKEDEVKIRTYIENKMTEALLRTCYKCNKKFIKADGCNKMTCSCGAFMCYVCGKPVKDYKHFNGAGGDRFDLCPLYSDTNNLHQEAVLKGAEEAKKEIGLDANSGKLKNDPTADVQKHYKEIAKKNPPPPVFPYVNPFGAVADNIVVMQRAQNQLLRAQQVVHQREQNELVAAQRAVHEALDRQRRRHRHNQNHQHQHHHH